jgi:NTE family protein
MNITLALGGGGSKGNSHIGVLRFLEQEGFQIRAIAGSSFGGLVACFYAAGFHPDQIEEIFSSLDQTRLYDRVRGENSSLLGLSRVSKWLDNTLGEKTFDDLLIPCAVTAVDLGTSQAIVLNKGLLRDAILSTIAVPGIFPPFQVDDFELIDGALLNPVPVALARSLAPSLPVVAVSLATPLGKPPRPVPFPLINDLPAPLVSGLRNLRVTKAFDIFVRSTDISNRQITELRLQIEKPDVVIRPEVDDIGILDKMDVHEIAKIGETAARVKLTELKDAASWSARLRHTITGGRK